MICCWTRLPSTCTKYSKVITWQQYIFPQWRSHGKRTILSDNRSKEILIKVTRHRFLSGYTVKKHLKQTFLERSLMSAAYASCLVVKLVPMALLFWVTYPEQERIQYWSFQIWKLVSDQWLKVLKSEGQCYQDFFRVFWWTYNPH